MLRLTPESTGVAASDQVHELLRRRFILAAAVRSALLRHGAANSRAGRGRFGIAADFEVAVAHELCPGNLLPTTRDAGESCKDAASHFVFGPARGTHFRAASTPFSVILAPDTSLI